jgi:hypothetical protein
VAQAYTLNEDTIMPRKLKLAQIEPDVAVEKIKARLLQLKCAPEQIDLHVSRLLTIKNRPKVEHYFRVDGGHRAEPRKRHSY